MRIWATGVGIVSAAGTGASATMDALCNGSRAFSEVTAFDVSRHRSRIAAVITDAAFEPPREARPGWSRTGALALAAARECLRSARIEARDGRVDLVVGGTTGPMLETEALLASLPGGASVPPELARAVSHPLSDATEMVREAASFRRVRTISSACSTGLNAIMLGALWLLSGRSERVLVGASDALCLLTFTGFSALGSLDPFPCRPFDRTRAGLTLGEGAAFLLLETDQSAASRGVKPLAELGGWAAAAEAHHITNPEPSGETAARVMMAAIRAAGIRSWDIDYVNAHGTATALNDPMEIRALRSVLGAEMARVSVSSSKGQIGHCLGAAGAIEAAVTALAIAQGRIPPTGGLSDIDPECDAMHVIGQARRAPVRAAITNSFGFGGLDSCVVFTAPESFPALRSTGRATVRVAAGSVLGPRGARSLDDAHELLKASDGAERIEGAVDLSGRLDASRARRLGRSERLLCVAIGDARARSALVDDDAGLVAGLASGNLDAAGRFLERVRDRGPQLAPPADFPNLMLSASAGHASIYHRLKGPVLAATDLGTCGSSAVLTALEVLEAKQATTMVVGSAMEASPVQAEVFRTWRGCPAATVSEGASCLVLTTGDSASEVEIREVALWHGAEARPRSLAGIPAPSGRCRGVLCGAGATEAYSESPWAAIEADAIETGTGCYEGSDGAAMVAAAAAIRSGRWESALVLACEGDRGYGFLLCRA